MRKLATKLLVALGLLTSGGAWAQTLTNKAVKATWAFDLGTSGQLAVMTDGSDIDVTSDYFKGSYVALGSNFKWGEKKSVASSDGGKLVETSVVCQSKQGSALADGTQYIDFMITPKKGLTFTPTKVSYTATRFGTGGGEINTYWVYSDGTAQTKLNGATVKPNLNNETPPYSEYSYEVTGVEGSSGASGMRLQLFSLGKDKHYGFCNIVIEGTLSGTIEEEVLYTVTTSVTPEDAGSINQSPAGASIALGEKVTFTPIANAGYVFLNKWTVNGVEVEGATYTIESLSENTTVVAQFAKNPVLTYAKPEGVYCVNRMFPKNVNNVKEGGIITLPNANYIYYKEGYTMTGWNVGGTNYAFGAEVTLNEDVTAEPVFTKNTVSLAARSAEVTVTYDFNTSTNGGRWVNIEGNADKVITRIRVDEHEIDYMMDADCTTGAGISGVYGKLNNTSGTTAQCNIGTVLTIHDVVKGSVITLTCNSDNTFTAATTFNGVAGTPSGQKAITYTATAAGDVKVIIGDGNVYLTTVTITYPYVPKEYAFVAEDADFYTLYLDYAVTVPANVTAYTGELNGNNMVLKEITDGYIKAGNAVLIQAKAAGTYTFVENTSAEAGTYAGNALKGVLVNTPVSKIVKQGTVLTLGKDSEGKVGFRQPKETYVSANKAYIDYVNNAPGAPAFVHILLAGEVTGIEGVQSVQQKATTNAIYNMMGQRVDANAKGLILMNGKKVIRK